MKMILSLLLFISWLPATAQSFQPDLHDKKKWRTIGRKSERKTENNRKVVYLNDEKSGGLYLLKDFLFSEGTIEFDTKGRDIDHKSFVGLAFHIVNDTTYEAVYFRPFNFYNTDTVRRVRAVQYVSVPGHDWPILRDSFPGKYERRVVDAPKAEDWFHVKIILKEKTILVFINGSEIPCLEVESLSNRQSGGIAFLVGSRSDGSFANLSIIKTQ